MRPPTVTPFIWYLIWLTASGGGAFLAYGWDKSQARRGGRRIPERTLHLLALAGGAAGAWLGRGLFRHKTRHASFTVVLVLATAIHGGILVWLIARS